jgi:hypothetical protein
MLATLFVGAARVICVRRAGACADAAALALANLALEASPLARDHRRCPPASLYLDFHCNPARADYGPVMKRPWVKTTLFGDDQHQLAFNPFAAAVRDIGCGCCALRNYRKNGQQF